MLNSTPDSQFEVSAGGNEVTHKKNRTDLASLVESACNSPAINLTMFPNAVSDFYWSTTPIANYSASVWLVSFDSGNDSGLGELGNKVSEQYLRFVRSEL